MTQRKKSKKHTSRRRRALWALGAAGVLCAFLLGLWWGTPEPRRPAPKQSVPRAKPAPQASTKPAAPKPKVLPPAKPATNQPDLSRPLVALVIDDMGYSVAQAKRLAALGIPLTISILPHSSRAKAVARLAQANGLEVMLHLPMEPKGFPRRNPGKGVLLCDMPSQRLLKVLQEDLAKVPQAVGVNNHMGSRFSLYPELLECVLLEIKKRGLYYLDSFTSADSKGLATAQRLGLRTGRRDVFLDHQVSREAIDEQMLRLMSVAKERGRAIAIGHPHSVTMKALESWAPRLKQQVSLVKVSEILGGPSGSGQGH
ncbi:MAG: divergent polysaccharide deacetylase family protein [Deltaproteobacteria bacterium]|nr:divergent polysaccharide deacetylase family protein [Deltaproteobacteria bacterium]